MHKDRLDMDDPLIHALGAKGVTILAGLAGAIVSLRYVKDLSPTRSAITVLSSAVLTTFVTPLATHIFGIPEVLSPGVSFLIGLCGLSLIGWVVSDPLAILKAWRGK